METTPGQIKTSTKPTFKSSTKKDEEPAAEPGASAEKPLMSKSKIRGAAAADALSQTVGSETEDSSSSSESSSEDEANLSDMEPDQAVKFLLKDINKGEKTKEEARLERQHKDKKEKKRKRKSKKDKKKSRRD